MYKIVLKITLIISLLLHSAGQGYALRPMATAKTKPKSISIPKTYFGRDGNALDFVVKTALSKIEDGGSINMLTVGSSDGREGYDVAMSVAEYAEATRKKINVKIIITDVVPELVNIARKGVYQKESVETPLRERDTDDFNKERTMYRFEKYFKPANDDNVRFLDEATLQSKYRIKIEYRTLDILDKQAVSNLANEQKFGLIIARNVHFKENKSNPAECRRQEHIFLDNIYVLLKENGLVQEGYSTSKKRYTENSQAIEFSLALAGVLRREDLLFSKLLRKYWRSDSYSLYTTVLRAAKIASTMVAVMDASSESSERRRLSFFRPTQEFTDIIEDMVRTSEFFGHDLHIWVFMFHILDNQENYMKQMWPFFWISDWDFKSPGGRAVFFISIAKQASLHLTDEAYSIVYEAIKDKMKESIEQNRRTKSLRISIEWDLLATYRAGRTTLKRELVESICRFYYGREPAEEIKMLDEIDLKRRGKIVLLIDSAA